MVLHLTESGVHHPRLKVFIHGGGVSGWMRYSKSAIFSISGDRPWSIRWLNRCYSTKHLMCS
nr:hypothetical protein [Bacillus subtilis]